MNKIPLLGDEAIAQAAIDAGVSAVYAYPGTPSTEITEYILKSKEAREGEIAASWTSNEKTAMESVLGTSYVGKRGMVCMKHVGLNVAADAFLNSAITGANGGLIVVAAGDPSMHSSQNEQDSRFFGNFAMIPMLEPSNQQQAYDMIHYGYELSEKFEIPVLMRITTRLAHSRAGVNQSKKRKQNALKMPKTAKQFILLPGNARRRYKMLLDTQDAFTAESENSVFNEYIDADEKHLGVIACGISYNYLVENYPDHKTPFPVLKIGQYPLPRKLIEKMYNECEEILVLEEGYPLVEESLRGFMNNGKTIKGRLDGSIPRDGELNPNIVAQALGIPHFEGRESSQHVVGRPPSLCKGCPHIYSYNALNEALEKYARGRVFADIGCYTLGALEPFNAINTCVDMGASITMARGAADAGLVPAVAVIGDSTFSHSGMTGLLDAILGKVPITVMILDNGTTAMTGGQYSNAHGKIEDICIGLGMDKKHIHVLNPIQKHHDENMAVIKKELEYNGVSVIIPRRECIQTLAAKIRAEKRKVKLATQ